ncbi:hypothetical protein J8273_4111 [Carpediemonas membranifera]|uniref:Uncharacterized protein n=1 Tax=Carpediemonas membranifera TaxID=201153 RepID=A0A8J6BYG1_9EUKA|nr:hypothetical protein J8273_4111 [Carpediemonas membranifera]|eukprot:KAG9394446.1 hypothetical protein J8273_4111 [Carpediemonas membranifera]
MRSVNDLMLPLIQGRQPRRMVLEIERDGEGKLHVRQLPDGPSAAPEHTPVQRKASRSPATKRSPEPSDDESSDVEYIGSASE